MRPRLQVPTRSFKNRIVRTGRGNPDKRGLGPRARQPSNLGISASVIAPGRLMGLPYTAKMVLSERDVGTKFITPVMEKAGWDVQTQVRDERAFE